MRSAIYSTFGKPAEVVNVQQTATPDPKANEVRIKTLLSAIHNHDLITIQGEYGNKPDLPAIGGSEAVGTIDAIGDEVSGFKKGQRVVVSGVQGTWSEYFIAPAKQLIPVPDAIDDEQAAQLIAMPMSALLLIEFLDIQPGQWIAQNAANGAVGESMAMLASERGVNTINIVRSEESKQELLDLGITENIVVTDNDDWKETVKEIVGDASILGAVDAVGGEAGGELVSLLGEKGVMASLGGMSGDPLTIDTSHMIFNGSMVKGFWAAKIMENASEEKMNRLTHELIERASSGKLKLPVGGIYSLDDIQKAVSDEVQSEKVGKVLVKP